MSEFADLFHRFDGSDTLSHEIRELVAYCEANVPEALPHLETLQSALDTLQSEGNRLSRLIFALHKKASSDWDFQRVRDEIRLLESVRQIGET